MKGTHPSHGTDVPDAGGRPSHHAAERHRAGLGTSITEGTANFLVNRRMNKSQQMRWSRRGADLLLQCAAFNGTL